MPNQNPNALRLTSTQLARACGCPLERASRWCDPINDAMSVWSIDTPRRVAAFLAQIAHESGRLVYVREIWGPSAAQARYEGRRDLGNVKAGDGKRFMGRGLVQITGRANYQACTASLRKAIPSQGVPDFEAEPEKLEMTRWAAYSAGWFWASRSLNVLADIGTEESFRTLTRRINGGLNGIEDRLALWTGARAALGI